MPTPEEIRGVSEIYSRLQLAEFWMLALEKIERCNIDTEEARREAAGYRDAYCNATDGDAKNVHRLRWEK